MSSNNLGVCVGQSLLRDGARVAAPTTAPSTSAAMGATMAPKWSQRIPRSHSKERQSHSFVLPSGSGGHKLLSLSSSYNSSTSLAASQKPNYSPPGATASALNKFAKRHRRARSQCLLASTLSLTNLSSQAPSVKEWSSGVAHLLEPNGQQETARYVPILLAFMIDEACQVFGAEVVELFGPAKPLKAEDGDRQQQEQAAPVTNNGAGEHNRTLNRRHLSTSVLVHVGCDTGQVVEQQQQQMVERKQVAEGGDDDDDDETGTTSILIVQAPAAPRRRLQCAAESQAPQEQQRPVSVTGSTVSSSSTSGVHSESPAFSSSTSNHSASGASSGCVSSASDSISSPSPMSGCVSPDRTDQVCGSAPRRRHEDDEQLSRHQIEVTREQLACTQRHLDAAAPLKVMDDVQAEHRQPLMAPSLVQPSAAPRGSKLSSNSVESEQQARARSMIGLDDLSPTCRKDHMSYVPQQQCHHVYELSQRFGAPTSLHGAALGRQAAPATGARMPKIPFEYTTSSYGGQAVLYYPSHAYRQRVEQQQQQQQFHSLGNESCRQMQDCQARQQMAPTNNEPARSHVMMLRDYYLSLQKQNQQQQQQRQRMIDSRAAIERLQLRHQLMQQHQHYSSLSLANLSQLRLESSGKANSEQSATQLVQSAVQVAPARPRLAKIRHNQFNGLYVKRLAQQLERPHPAGEPQRPIGNEAPKQQQLVRASSSQHVSPILTSSSSADSSSCSNASSGDECDEWMESTTV